MDTVEINEDIAVGVVYDYVIVTMKSAFKEEGETLDHEVFIGMEPEEAIKFANAILHAAANVPAEPDDLYLEDGSINPAYA